MRLWLRSHWASLRASYWFVPTLMGVGAMGLAWLGMQVDAGVERAGLRLPPLVYPGGAEGARSVLSTLAASTLGIAGVSFSVTLARVAPHFPAEGGGHEALRFRAQAAWREMAVRLPKGSCRAAPGA